MNSFKQIFVKTLLVSSLLVSSNLIAQNLINNGSFETTIPSSGSGELGDNIVAPPWNTLSTNVNLIFNFGSQTVSTTVDGNFSLAGSVTPHSPDGGNFLASLNSFAFITQTVNGLTIGQSYTLGFYWAGAMKTNIPIGSALESWSVTLGSQTQNTAIVSVPPQTFSGWMLQTFVFTATSSTEILKFQALVSGNTTNAAVLLDGVSLVAVPEPGTLSLMLGGLIGVYRTMKSRSRTKKSRSRTKSH